MRTRQRNEFLPEMRHQWSGLYRVCFFVRVFSCGCVCFGRVVELVVPMCFCGAPVYMLSHIMQVYRLLSKKISTQYFPINDQEGGPFHKTAMAAVRKELKYLVTKLM